MYINVLCISITFDIRKFNFYVNMHI